MGTLMLVICIFLLKKGIANNVASIKLNSFKYNNLHFILFLLWIYYLYRVWFFLVWFISRIF